jgi:hypothetical protein
MIPSLQPTNLAVILDLTSPEQKLSQPLVTTPEKDTEADTGETNDGKQGSPNSDPPGNKGNSSENEGEASGSPPSGGGGAEDEDNTGGNGNGGHDADHPDNSNPGAGQGSQKKKKRRPRKKSRRVNHQRDHLPAISRLPRLPRIRHSRTQL